MTAPATPSEPQAIRHCVICWREFADDRDTWDHGHDAHGTFHFQDPTIEGPRPAATHYPLTFEEEYDRAEAWIKESWSSE